MAASSGKPSLVWPPPHSLLCADVNVPNPSSLAWCLGLYSLLHPPFLCVFQIPRKLSAPAWVCNLLMISPQLFLLLSLPIVPQTIMASDLHPLLSPLLPDSGPLVKAKHCSRLSVQRPQSQAFQTGKARTNPAQLGLSLAGTTVDSQLDDRLQHLRAEGS